MRLIDLAQVTPQSFPDLNRDGASRILKVDAQVLPVKAFDFEVEDLRCYPNLSEQSLRRYNRFTFMALEYLHRHPTVLKFLKDVDRERVGVYVGAPFEGRDQDFSDALEVSPDSLSKSCRRLLKSNYVLTNNWGLAPCHLSSELGTTGPTHALYLDQKFALSNLLKKIACDFLDFKLSAALLVLIDTPSVYVLDTWQSLYPTEKSLQESVTLLTFASASLATRFPDAQEIAPAAMEEMNDEILKSLLRSDDAK